MRYFSILIFFSFLCSCGNSPQQKTVNDHTQAVIHPYRTAKASEGFSLAVPLHLTSAPGLNENASLQYADADSNEYVIAINEDKKVFTDSMTLLNTYNAKKSVLENYAAMRLDDMATSVKIDGSIVTTKVSVDSCEAVYAEFKATIPDIPDPIAYKMMFIVTPTDLYTITAWCLAPDETRYHDELKNMLFSFRKSR